MRLAFLRHNLGLKLVSLLIGTSIYVYVQTLESDKTTKTFEVPLQIDRNHPDLVFVSASDEDGRPKTHIQMTMTGPAEELAQLDAARIQKSLAAFVELSRGQAGEMDYPVKVRWGKEFSKYSWKWDGWVRVLTEPLRRAQRAVTVVTTGSSQAGMDYGTASVEPPMVEIVGAESKVLRVRTVRVLLDLRRAVSGVPQAITIELLDAAERPVEGVAANPATVSVRPVLTPSTPWREVFVAPRFRGSAASGYRVASYTVLPDTVEIQGDPKLLRLFGTLETEPVDIEGLSVSVQRDVGLVLPRGLRLRNPVRVKVRVAIEPDQGLRTIPGASRDQ